MKSKHTYARVDLKSATEKIILGNSFVREVYSHRTELHIHFIHFT